ncbi:MAG: ABC-type glutathione transport system ATPase component, partial [Flavobacteriaceae bacterium]
GIIKDLASKSGVTVLVSSHDLMHVTDVCERIVVLEKGQLVKDIKTAPATLKELEAYFAGTVEKPVISESSASEVSGESNTTLESETPIS